MPLHQPKPQYLAGKIIAHRGKLYMHLQRGPNDWIKRSTGLSLDQEPEAQEALHRELFGDARVLRVAGAANAAGAVRRLARVPDAVAPAIAPATQLAPAEPGKSTAPGDSLVQGDSLHQDNLQTIRASLAGAIDALDCFAPGEGFLESGALLSGAIDTGLLAPGKIAALVQSAIVEMPSAQGRGTFVWRKDLTQAQRIRLALSAMRGQDYERVMRLLIELLT